MREENYFIVISKSESIDFSSISTTRKGAIANFIEGTTVSWKDCQRYGWRIVKCKIIIKL